MRFVGLIAAACVMVAGCSDNPISPEGSSSVTVGTSTRPTLPQSSSEALAATLAGLPSTLRATLGTTPTDVPYDYGSWLHVSIDVAGTSPASQVEAAWEAALLLGAVNDRTASAMKGMDIDLVSPDGTTGKGLQPTNRDVAAGQSFGPVGDDDTVRADVTDVLARYGLDAVTIEVQHPLDVALKVVASAPTADVLAGRLAELHAALMGTPYRYEGVSLEIQVPSGEPVAALATALRIGQTSQWVRSDVADAVGGYVFSTTPSTP